MNKSFYSIELDCSEGYSTLCNLIKKSKRENIKWYQETGFSYFLELNKLFYSCNEDDSEKFEKMLKDFNIRFEHVTCIQEKYELYLSTIPQNSVQREQICEEDKAIVFEEEVQKIIEGPNGTRCLTEETISCKDKIRVYIESNEKCNHHIPHAHVDYNHDFNVFSISLIDFAILARDSHGVKGKKAVELLKNNIAKAKIIWNQCENHSKFDKGIGGELLNTYHFEK